MNLDFYVVFYKTEIDSVVTIFHSTRNTHVLRKTSIFDHCD